MDIIYAFSQLSDHAQRANLSRAEKARGEAVPPGMVEKRHRAEVSVESTASCLDSVLGYLCERYTRALRDLERPASLSRGPIASSKVSSGYLTPFSKGETFKTVMVLQLLAAGARQHPALRDWLWSVVAGLPEGANCVAMTLEIVQLQEVFLLKKWAHVANLKGIHGIEAESTRDASLIVAGDAWLSSVLTELESLCWKSLPVTFPPLPQLSTNQPSCPSDGNFDHGVSKATGSFLSINDFSESLFSSLDPADALQELPPQLSIYALLRNPTKRHLFVNSLLRNPIIESPLTNEDAIREAADCGMGHPDPFNPFALLSSRAYAWLIPLWSHEEDHAAARGSSFSPSMEATSKLICRPPPDGGLSWVCSSAAFPAHYERRLHTDFTRHLCGGASPPPPTPPPEGFTAVTSSKALGSFHDEDSHTARSFTPDAYVQLQSRASYEAALGVAAVLLAEHLQQASVTLSPCNSGGDSRTNETLSHSSPQPTGASFLKEGDSLSRVAFTEYRGNELYGAPGDDSTPLEGALTMMQLDEEVVCGSYEDSTKSAGGDPLYGDLLRRCNAAWTALVVTLAVGGGIPAQFVRMCLDPLEVSLRGCPCKLGKTSQCAKFLGLRNYLKEYSSCHSKASSGEFSPQHIVADTANTPSDAQAKTTDSVVISNHPNGPLGGSSGSNDNALAYQVIFPSPIFLLRAEDVALYTHNLPFMRTSEISSGMRNNREEKTSAEGRKDAPDLVSDEACPPPNPLLGDLSLDYPPRCSCVSSSMATVVAVALRHPRVEMFQLECIWQLLYFHHCNNGRTTAQTPEGAFQVHKSNPSDNPIDLPEGKKTADSAQRRPHDSEHLSGLHGDRIEEGEQRTRLTSSERIQHERVEEMGRRMQQIFDCFAYSALAGVSPCRTWERKSSNEEDSVKGMRLVGCDDKSKPSTAPKDDYRTDPETHLSGLPMDSRRINFNHVSTGTRRVLRLELAKETKANSSTFTVRQDSAPKSRMQSLDVEEDSLNRKESITVEENTKDLFRNKRECEIDMQAMLQLVAKLSIPLEATGLSASLQKIIDTLLLPLETLWTTCTTSDAGNSTLVPLNTVEHDKRYLSLSLVSSKRSDRTCGNLRETKLTEFTLQRQERRQLLTLTTPEYVKQFQNVLSILFQIPSLEHHSTSIAKSGGCNVNPLYFKSAVLAVQSATKATVGTILCFCIYRFLLHCYLQVSSNSWYGATLFVTKEVGLPKNISIDRAPSEITFAKQEANQNCEPLRLSDGVSQTDAHASLQRKLRLVVQHTTSTLKPILQSYVGACLPRNRSDIEASQSFSGSFRGRIMEVENKHESKKIFYGPVSCILLPMVLRAYEAALKPVLHDANNPTAPELSDLKDILKQHGIIP
ncbi:unnamed protein product [Phytomonas sp. Hart1]|nr:unnamed protein product [Phytomonas sp. Hart1]|eukprot:CCW68338.1 unnamed protein product [Phytomonas sp. isolate Hart1]